VQGYRRKIREEPLEDYIKNIMLTNNDYLQKWRSELNIKRRLEKKKLLRWKLRRIKTLRLLKRRREKDAQVRQAFKRKWIAYVIC
jgi:hypothetical protein